jgi:hypothetical protein
VLSVRDSRIRAAEAAKVDPRRFADAVCSEGSPGVGPNDGPDKASDSSGKIRRSLSDSGDENRLRGVAQSVATTVSKCWCPRGQRCYNWESDIMQVAEERGCFEV